MDNYLKRQLLYEHAVKKINKYSNDFIVLSFHYYSKKSYLARFVQWISRVKGYEEIAHTAAIYKFGSDPRFFESKYKGINHSGLYDSIFDGNFEGKVTAHVLPAKQTAYKRQKLIYYIEHKLLGGHYGTLQALGSLLDIVIEENDIKKNHFCSKLVSYIYQMIIDNSCFFGHNNSKLCPAEFYKLVGERAIYNFTVFDSKKI
jgi:hypothetical protein